MKFKIKVCEVKDPTISFEETYTEDIQDPIKWGQDLVAKYNAEIPHKGGDLRKFLGAEILSEINKHDWIKSNTATIQKGKSIYDTYECKRCHITGKRFGLNFSIIRDPKFKAKKFENCVKT